MFQTCNPVYPVSFLLIRLMGIYGLMKCMIFFFFFFPPNSFMLDAYILRVCNMYIHNYMIYMIFIYEQCDAYIIRHAFGLWSLGNLIRDRGMYASSGMPALMV